MDYDRALKRLNVEPLRNMLLNCIKELEII
jgi:hypothetical protein